MTINQLLRDVPPDWRVASVGDALQIRNDLRAPINRETRETIAGSYPYLGPTGVLDRIDHFRVEGEFALIGEDGDHFLKHAEHSMTIWVTGRYNVNNHAHLVGSTEQCYAKWFFYYYMHTSLGEYLTRQGVGRYKLTKAALEKLPVALPPLSEQRKIADILGTWDEALEKLDVLIAAKGRRNLALMQQLLAVAAQKIGHGHARHRLGEVVERITRKNSIENENVLTISAQDGLINQREYFNRSVAGANLAGYFQLRRGEFAYNRSSSIGFPYGAIKRLDRYDAGIVSTLYLCFRIKDGAKVSSDYLAHYLDGGFLNSGLRSIAKEGARAHGLLNVTADEFLDIDIFLPPLPLQTKIAAVLDTADAELRLLRQQRTALDHQKRGLMQLLLTGKVRVRL
jgi:type I restriction enzyme S subunit